MPIPDLKETVTVETVNYPESKRITVVVDGGWAHHMQIRWFVLRYLKSEWRGWKDLNVSHLRITKRSYAIVMPAG